jgi:hypothetical protein
MTPQRPTTRNSAVDLDHNPVFEENSAVDLDHNPVLEEKVFDQVSCPGFFTSHA